jgi:putative aldouronate transport system permease protein
MYGIIIAFEKFSPFRGITGGPWVGFRWFIEFFESMYFWRLLRNTVLLNILSILFSFPAPIILALLLNEIHHSKFKRISQSISYMPHFISQVVLVGIVINFLSPTTGIINHCIKAFGFTPVQFMSSAAWFRPVYIASGIWQGIGWGSIIYLAALAGISTELYEAATIDGASKLRQLWHISLPGIMPTIVILLLLSIGNLLSVGPDKVLLMYNPLTYDTADVISTYVYRRGLLEGEYSFATAVGLFSAVFNFLLLASVNMISKRVNEVSLW